MPSTLPRTLAAIAVLLAFVRPAGATHWRVAPGGGGDFTTIQAALDMGGRDSVLVEPGVYPETLLYTPSTPSVVLIGIGGAAVTRIETLVTGELAYVRGPAGVLPERRSRRTPARRSHAAALAQSVLGRGFLHRGQP